jgi:hypothetical protein
LAVVVAESALDAEDAAVEVNVAPCGDERLADAEPGKGEQDEERVIAGRLPLATGLVAAIDDIVPAVDCVRVSAKLLR